MFVHSLGLTLCLCTLSALSLEMALQRSEYGNIREMCDMSYTVCKLCKGITFLVGLDNTKVRESGLNVLI